MLIARKRKYQMCGKFLPVYLDKYFDEIKPRV